MNPKQKALTAKKTLILTKKPEPKTRKVPLNTIAKSNDTQEV